MDNLRFWQRGGRRVKSKPETFEIRKITETRNLEIRNKLETARIEIRNRLEIMKHETVRDKIRNRENREPSTPVNNRV